MSKCHRLDLQTLGSQPLIPKNVPDHRVTSPIENIHFPCLRGWRVHVA